MTYFAFALFFLALVASVAASLPNITKKAAQFSTCECNDTSIHDRWMNGSQTNETDTWHGCKPLNFSIANWTEQCVPGSVWVQFMHKNNNVLVNHSSKCPQNNTNTNDTNCTNTGGNCNDTNNINTGGNSNVTQLSNQSYPLRAWIYLVHTYDNLKHHFSQNKLDWEYLQTQLPNMPNVTSTMPNVTSILDSEFQRFDQFKIWCREHLPEWAVIRSRIYTLVTTITMMSLIPCVIWWLYTHHDAIGKFVTSYALRGVLFVLGSAQLGCTVTVLMYMVYCAIYYTGKLVSWFFGNGLVSDCVETFKKVKTYWKRTPTIRTTGIPPRPPIRIAPPSTRTTTSGMTSNANVIQKVKLSAEYRQWKYIETAQVNGEEWALTPEAQRELCENEEAATLLMWHSMQTSGPLENPSAFGFY